MNDIYDIKTAFVLLPFIREWLFLLGAIVTIGLIRTISLVFFGAPPIKPIAMPQPNAKEEALTALRKASTIADEDAFLDAVSHVVRTYLQAAQLVDFAPSKTGTEIHHEFQSELWRQLSNAIDGMRYAETPEDEPRLSDLKRANLIKLAESIVLHRKGDTRPPTRERSV